MKRLYRRQLTWLKMLRKHWKISLKLSAIPEGKLRYMLLSKLEKLERRIRRIQRKHAVGFGVLCLAVSTNTQAQNFNLSTDLTPALGHSTLGITTENYYSDSLANIKTLPNGDFNGDGFTDYFVGTYILWGDGGLPVLNRALLSPDQYTLVQAATTPTSVQDNLIEFLDFNNDGVMDIVSRKYGLYTVDQGNWTHDGYTSMLITFGGAGFKTDTLNLEFFNDHDRIELYPNDISDYNFGNQLEILGDMNGDGITDLGVHSEGSQKEFAFILYGNSIADRDSVAFDDLDLNQRTFINNYNFSPFIASLTAYDLTGDGLNDLVMEGYCDNRVAVVFGQQGTLGESIDMSNPDLLITDDKNECFGHSISLLGDINHDGFDDLGVANYDYYGIAEEKSYVIFGSDDFEETLSTDELDGENGFVMKGVTLLQGLGDVTGDGIDDMAIVGSNQLKVIPGSCENFDLAMETEEVNQRIERVISTEGFSLSYIPRDIDINNDGVQDHLFVTTVAGSGGAGWVHEFRVLYGDGVQNPLCTYANVVVDFSQIGGVNPLPHTEVEVPNLGSFYSNNDGLVKFRIPEPGQYDLNISSIYDYVDFEHESLSLNIDADLDTVVHYTFNSAIYDPGIVINSGNIARPGFGYNLQLDARNYGTEELHNSVVTLTVSPDYTVKSISDGGTQIGNTISWVVPSMKQFEISKLRVAGRIDSTTMLGDQVYFVAEIDASANNDNVISNNLDIRREIVTGSYDPNDKTTLDSIAPSFIENGEYLEYLIRFQNTGTDTAFTVVVTDTLSQDLQWDTYELVSTSHDVKVERQSGNILRFRFDDILLVDSTANEPDSHGFIRFKIKPETSLMDGDEILGTANIYFDYNAPVITNTMVTEVKALLITSLDENEENDFVVFPNPTQDRVMLGKEAKDQEWVLYNTSGQKLSAGYSRAVNVQNYPMGIYILVVEGKSYKITKE